MARGNPVNMERIATKSNAPGWSASLDLSGGVKEGNVVKREINFGGGVQYRTFHPRVDTTVPAFFRDRWMLSSNVSLVKFSGDNVTDNGFMHVRYTRMIVPRVGPEVFVQSQYNAFNNLRSRLLAGGGARVDVVHRNLFGLWGGTGYMGEYEVNTIEGCTPVDEDDCSTFTPDPHPSETFNHRWTSYVSMRLDVLDEQLLLSSTTYLQPRLDDFTDIRINTGFQLEAKLGAVFSLGSDFEVRYDARPPRPVLKTDISFSGFLRFRFG